MRAHLLILVSILVLACGRTPSSEEDPGAEPNAAAAKTAAPDGETPEPDAAATPEANGERAKEARAQLKELQTALELYYLVNNGYPEELSELTKPPAAGETAVLTRIPNDPWGHAYVYVVETSDGAPSFRIHSLGPDGVEGTDDDVMAPDR